jgi:hypothetical protein
MAALTSAAGVRKPPGEQMDAQRGAYQLRPKLQRLVTASQSRPHHLRATERRSRSPTKRMCSEIIGDYP